MCTIIMKMTLRFKEDTNASVLLCNQNDTFVYIFPEKRKQFYVKIRGFPLLNFERWFV